MRSFVTALARGVLFLLVLAVGFRASAQQPRQLAPGEILLGMQRLKVLGSVLYIAAHPDDENTQLLAWLAKEKKVRTGYLSLTRGDGGQNLIGSEQGEALGIIRTQELLAARRIDGAEQFFTRAFDFGFSKNPQEAFRIWNKDSILEDVVYIIRAFRPDVIITRFPTTGEGGHGHHTASAILAEEAFEAAADPSRFTWLNIPAWKTRRLFWNTFNFGELNTTSPDQLKIDVGGYNPLLGKSYGEIAAESRSMHKSQGFGSAPQRGSHIEYFRQIKGDPVKSDIFEGLDLTWSRLPARFNRAAAVDSIMRRFDALHPERSAASLHKLIPDLLHYRNEPDSSRYWRSIKSAEAEALALACTGAWIEALASRPGDAIHSKYDIRLQAIARTPGDVHIDNALWFGNSAVLPYGRKQGLQMDTFNISFDMRGGGGASATLSNPYWLASPRRGGLYVRQYDWQRMRADGPEENDPAILLQMQVDGARYSLLRPVVYKEVDPVKGEIYHPFEILPPVTANFAEKAFVFEAGKPRRIQITLSNNGDSARGYMELKLPEGWKADMQRFNFSFLKRGGNQVLDILITPGPEVSSGIIRAEMVLGAWRYSYGLQRIRYDHIPSQVYFPPAEARVSCVTTGKAGTNIGYVQGAGDKVPAALRQLGYTVTELDERAVADKDLSGFDAIVMGVRAYNTNAWLQAQYPKLMRYVKEGGNLIVQYNTSNRIGPLKAQIGPDSFTITSKRVTDETAEVRIVAPDHPAVNFPNKINARDFEGWVQERGTYFAEQMNPRFQTVLSMNDPGEPAHEGSLIIEPYGTGNFVYTGIAFFRQLPVGVPGAYRLFVNLLSLPKNKN